MRECKAGPIIGIRSANDSQTSHCCPPVNWCINSVLLYCVQSVLELCSGTVLKMVGTRGRGISGIWRVAIFELSIISLCFGVRFLNGLGLINFNNWFDWIFFFIDSSDCLILVLCFEWELSFVNENYRLLID